MNDRAGERLDGWKAIARHFGRDERTVKRWEARGLPVGRVPGGGARAPVYANTVDLDRWLNAQGPLPEETDAEPDEEATPADVMARVPATTIAARPARRRWPLAFAAAATAVVLIGTVAARRYADPDPAAGQTRFDPQARDRYLSGMAAWNLRTPMSLAQARDDFGAAIAREPGYAQAYAGLSQTYLLLREFGSMPEPEAYARADTAADTALKLDPNLAAAHRAKAFVLYWSKHDPAEAWAEFDRAEKLAPADALTWHWRATALQNAGRLPEALAAIEHARALDPTSTALLADDGLMLYFAGRRAEARVRLERVVLLDPTNADAHRYLGEIAHREGRLQDAAAEWRLFAQLRGTPDLTDTQIRAMDTTDVTMR